MKKLLTLMLPVILAMVLPVSGVSGNTTILPPAESAAHEDNSPALVLAASDAAARDETFTAPDDYDDYEDEDLPWLDDEDEELNVYDPLETINRGTFWFNDKLYFYLLKPVARGYRWIMPDPLMLGIGNFFSNLASPMRIINAGLQGKFSDAGNELTRFAVNTTIGIGGFFDTAKDHFNLTKKEEDTGQTLGYYGIGPGPYLVLPFFGPSSFRDGVGLLADSRMDLTYYLWEDRDYWAAIILETVNIVALDKDTYEGVKKDALDPYLFVRDAWTQYRQNKVEN
jgi:phospholipid-binding lipoprotein MlaA